jgi:plastocyanin
MRRIALLLASLALLAAGCGGDDESSSPAERATSTPQNTGGGGAAGDDTVQITMKDIKFDPVDATAKVGQQVVWTNEDDAPHNVVGGPIKSETFGKGETFEYEATEAGTIDYVCTIHPGMEGKLTVTDG